MAKAELSFYKSLEVCQRLKQTVDNKEYNEMKCRLLLNLGKLDVFLNVTVFIDIPSHVQTVLFQGLWTITKVTARNVRVI